MEPPTVSRFFYHRHYSEQKAKVKRFCGGPQPPTVNFPHRTVITASHATKKKPCLPHSERQGLIPSIQRSYKLAELADHAEKSDRNVQNRNPDSIIATGSVSTQAISKLRTVAHCKPV